VARADYRAQVPSVESDCLPCPWGAARTMRHLSEPPACDVGALGDSPEAKDSSPAGPKRSYSLGSNVAIIRASCHSSIG
jgi:hypothetical protein